MREITGAWLARDRKRIAVRLGDGVIWVTDYGPQLDVTYEIDYLPSCAMGDEWDELFPETDFS